jgi:hypothetical protein
MLWANASAHDKRLVYAVEYAAKMTSTSSIKYEIPHLFGILWRKNESFFNMKLL